MTQPNLEEAKAQAADLARRLKQQLRENRAKTTQVSRALGYAPEYLGRALRGAIDLKLVDVFAVLRVLGVSPRTFLARHYPLAGGTVQPATEVSGVLLEVQALLDRAAGPQSVPEPEVIDERAAGLLRGLISRAGKTQRSVARELSMSELALGEILRGRANLRAWHVFAVLATTGTSPAVYFHDLLAAGGGEPFLAGEAAGELTELLQRALEAFAESFESASGEEPRRAPPGRAEANDEPGRKAPSRRSSNLVAKPRTRRQAGPKPPRLPSSRVRRPR